MPFYKPVKVIASVGGSSSAPDPGGGGGTVEAGNEVIVSYNEPLTRPNGEPLETGDSWYNQIDGFYYIFTDKWEVVKVESDTTTRSTSLDERLPPDLFPYGTSPSIDFPDDYPSFYGRETQRDANEFFLHADLWALKEILELKDRVDNIADDLYPNFDDYNFNAVPPIDVHLNNNKVTWFMDMSQLDDIKTANPYISNRIALPSELEDLIPTVKIDDSLYMNSEIPVIADLYYKDFYLSFDLKGANDIKDGDLMDTTIINKIDQQGVYSFFATKPMVVLSRDDTEVTYGFLISSLNKI